MKRSFLTAGVLLVVGTWAGGAQEPSPQPESPPSTALEVLQRYVQRTPQPLQNREVSSGLSYFIGGTAATLGCAGLALIPTINDRGPEGEDEDYFTPSLLLSSLQGMCISPFIGMGLSQLLFPTLDMRAEYGSLLDLEEKDRELRAAMILRKMAGRAKQQRVAAIFFCIAAAALPAGAYYAGTRIWGPNPNVEKVDQGYLTGIALGSLVPVLMLLTTEWETERLDEQFRAAPHSGRKE